MIDILIGRDFSNEFRFSASRSSGPGGQNVNKLSTKVELRFNISQSELLTRDEKIALIEKLAHKITKDGDLIIVSQSERSQLANKERTIEKFYGLLIKILTPQKKRRVTKPSKQAKEKRLENKRILSEKKANRKRIDD
jgi:ribosome-associated protein